MVAIRGRTFKKPWQRSCLSSKLKSSSAPIGREDSWCFHAVGSSNAPLLGSTAAEGLPRIGRTSIAPQWCSDGLPQSASCSKTFEIPPDVFGQTLNTAVIRVTTEHYSLLQKWAELLGSEQYQRWQHVEWTETAMPPVHLVGDQDVLTALLASVEYSQVPVRMLNRGKAIIQYFTLKGYTTAERIRNLFTGVPAFVHSQGPKPWWVE